MSTISTKCVQCHSREPGLPFYSKLPIASSMIHEDVEEGTAHIDFASDLGRLGELPASEVTLAKTEHVLREGSMPPRKYVMLHWNHGLSDDDREALQAWIDQTRVCRRTRPSPAQRVTTWQRAAPTRSAIRSVSAGPVTHAIAEFERTLVTPNSAFDRYLMGDAEALTGEFQGAVLQERADRTTAPSTGRPPGGRSRARGR